jgi:VIT1/CCC1 family predicted Fe2+/Mn2+ transporter
MEKVVMGIVRDLLMIVGDAARLSESLMQLTFEAPKRAVKQGVGRVITRLVIYASSLILAGVGVGFIVGGGFVLLARVLGSPGIAGLITGFAVLLISLIVAIIGRGFRSGS